MTAGVNTLADQGEATSNSWHGATPTSHMEPQIGLQPCALPHHDLQPHVLQRHHVTCASVEGQVRMGEADHMDTSFDPISVFTDRNEPLVNAKDEWGADVLWISSPPASRKKQAVVWRNPTAGCLGQASTPSPQQLCLAPIGRHHDSSTIGSK